jgi:hypothetical protein
MLEVCCAAKGNAGAIKDNWGSSMLENERREADVLCARDLVVRGITFCGLITAVFLALLAIQSL